MSWLRCVAPTIASALGGPFAGLAVDAVSKAIGIEPTEANKTITNEMLPYEIQAYLTRTTQI